MKISVSLYRYGIQLLLIAVFLIVLAPPNIVKAVTQDDINSIIDETPFFDPGTQSCASSSSFSSSVNGASVALDGNNPKIAFDFFVSNGYTTEQSAGIVGNLMYESGGVNPTQEEIGGGGGYGIAQFTGPELTNLQTWAAANNQDYTTLQTQLNYMIYDLSNNESAAAQAVKAATSVEDATNAFMVNYERPGNPQATLQPRVTDAQDAFNLYASSSGGATTAACSNGSTSPNCQSAVGDAMILCVAEQYSGIYYQWGGGHDGYGEFRDQCPISAVATAATSSTVNNTGPCATDCAGLVSVAVDQAFNLNYDWTVINTAMSGDGSQYWQQIPMTQVQAGDIVTAPSHVEIVDHYDASTQMLYTFGSHETGTTTGPDVHALGVLFTNAYHWTGPGS